MRCRRKKRELRKIKHNIEKVLAGSFVVAFSISSFSSFFPFFMTCFGFAGEPKINEVFHPILAGRKTSTRDSSQAWRKVIDSLISRVDRLWKFLSQIIFHISSVHYHLEWNWMKIAWKSILLLLINAESRERKVQRTFQHLSAIYRRRFNEITAEWWEGRTKT